MTKHLPLETTSILFSSMVIVLMVFCRLNRGNECRRLIISEILEDKALTNHTIRTIQPITDAAECARHCYLEPLCFTYNLCKQDNWKMCELTNSSRVRHQKDLVDKEGCTYHGSKAQCSTNHHCPPKATCQGLLDAKKCHCNEGFEGENCQDIDECSAGTHDCHVNATCTNTIGGYTCSCKTGHSGNGTHCCEWKILFDFEDGKKTGWTLSGKAFNNQPTYDDNPSFRSREPSNHEGNWWIGGYENRSTPLGTPGAVQGDHFIGNMTSPPFEIQGDELRFLIGGGCLMTLVRAELLIGQTVVANETGVCFETMARKYWDVRRYRGRKAQVRLIDQRKDDWGHINFDHLEGQVCHGD